VGAGYKCLAVAGMLALAAPALSAAQGYRTDVFVPADQNECASVPGCASVSQAPVTIPARGRTPARFWCTESHPHLWKWDVGQHEHVSVKLVAVDRFSATIEGTNLADAVGHFVVYLGCSTSPYAGSAIMDSRHLAPTGWLGR
jgi:hypothetical protein